jgi:hypothetical protein
MNAVASLATSLFRTTHLRRSEPSMAETNIWLERLRAPSAARRDKCTVRKCEVAKEDLLRLVEGHAAYAAAGVRVMAVVAAITAAGERGEADEQRCFLLAAEGRFASLQSAAHVAADANKRHTAS